MTVEIERTRPAVLRESSARELDAYLAFRHGFRNLYLFDLDAAAMAPLMGRSEAVWREVEMDLRAFASSLRSIASLSEGENR